MQKNLGVILTIVLLTSILAGCKTTPVIKTTPTSTATNSVITTSPVVNTTTETVITTTPPAVTTTQSIATTATTTTTTTTNNTITVPTTATTTVSTTTASSVFFPTSSWRTSDPANQGVDVNKLDELMTYIGSRNLAVDSVVVIRHGYLVYEKYPGYYDQNIKHIIYSCSKSVLGVLIGIAIKEGYIDSLQHKALDYFADRTIANMDSRKSNITLENLMKMNAGMAFNEWALPYTDPNNAWIKILYSPDPIQAILDLPMAAEPGAVWNYCGGYTYLLSAILMKATNMTLLEFANKYLFAPMGITDVSWSTNANVSKTIPNFYDAAGGLSLTPRDMAKFGYLILHKGMWDGQQLVPADFVTDATKVQSSFGYNSGYGYESWWTYQADKMFYAAGIYGQKIFVVPNLDLVVVFTANIRTSNVDTEQQKFMKSYIVPACN